MNRVLGSRTLGGILLALSLSLISGCTAISDSGGKSAEIDPPLALGVSDISRLTKMNIGQSAYVNGLVGGASAYLIESSHPEIVSSVALSVDDNTVHGIQPLRISALSPGIAEIRVRQWPVTPDTPPLRTYRIEVPG